MKIVCDACQAKYSISDDKVQGKVFKIRCKKCSNIIVVRGGASAAEPAPPAQEKDTRVYDYGYEGGGEAPPAGADDAVWHVVINSDQVGPMTAAEVQQRFAASEIDAETYAWREGFADWIPLSQVDAFAELVSSGSVTTAAAGNGSGNVAAMFGGGEEAGTVRSDPGDLFAAASSRGAEASDDGGDLFGSKPVATKDQAQATSSKLRGERNENSVLFSLNNLAQLASDKPMVSSSSSSASSSGHATGAAGGEGSGLIDIRSMASAYLGGGGALGAKPATSSAIGSIDDLPVFGGGGGFSEPAVIVPTARAQSNSKMMYVLIGSVGLLAVAAIILVVVMLKKGDGDDKKLTTVAVVEPPTPDDTTKKPDDNATAKPPDTKKPDDTAKPDDATKKPDDTAVAKPDDTKKPEVVKKPDPKPAVTKKPDPKPTTPTTPTTVAKVDPKKPDTKKPDEPKNSGGCDEVSCVLSNYEGACCAKYRKGPAPKPTNPIGEKPRSDVPESLDRGMIAEGVGPVKGKVMSCGDKSSSKGTVKVSVKVNPDGGVASVSVKATPDPGLGSCVAGAMQRARFKKTQTGGTFGYPFVF